MKMTQRGGWWRLRARGARSAVMLGAAAALCAVAIAPAAGAQVETRTMRIEDAPAPVRLGARAEVVRQRWPVAPVVVVTPDAASYVDALARWSLDARFPVLIDDGTDEAREAIGMFVRAFSPDRVVRWSGEGDAAGDRDERDIRGVLQGVLARVWGAGDPVLLRKTWTGMGFEPPGVVVAARNDGAWTAAAALSVARGQPIVWANMPQGGLAAQLDAAALAALRDEIHAGVDALGWPWRDLGDAIDAVTLCFNGPTKVAGESGALALTDVIGRRVGGERWAWTGVVTGTEAMAAQRAMCAIFLQPQRGWFFDGYTGGGAFRQYDVQPAGMLWERSGRTAMIDARGQGTLADWRRRARGGVDAGFIHVNTAGNRGFFQLGDERGYATDVPALKTPAIVHFVHSFSAQHMGDPLSIGAVWLERGAYAYFGSVDEPFLTAFHTPESVTARLLSGAAWGAAVRRDGATAWKVNVFGDPLLTIGSQPPPAGPMPELAGSQDVEALMRDALTARRFDEGGRLLALLGRDADTLRLAMGVAKSDGVSLTPALASAALHAMARTGDATDVALIARVLGDAALENRALVDRLWLVVRPTFAVTRDSAGLHLLRKRFAGAGLVRDAEELAFAIRRTDGAATARMVLMEAMEVAPAGRPQTELMQALDRLRGSRASDSGRGG